MSRSISKMAIVLMTVLCIVIVSAFSASSSAILGHPLSAESEGQNRAMTETATQTIPSGQYFIKNRYSGKYLTYEGVNVSQASRSNNLIMQQQRWNVVYMGNGYYYLEPMSNVGYRLDIANAANYNGANVGIHPTNGGLAQKYQIISCGSNSYRLAPACCTDSRIVEVVGASTDEGANVQIWEYVGQTHQQWTFEEASSEPYHAYEWSWVFEDGIGTYISSGYRSSSRPDHFGIDLVTDPVVNSDGIYGEDILAPTSGKVVKIYENHSSGGHTLVLETDNYTVDGNPIRVGFLHMILGSSPLEEDQIITAGTVIGKVGNTGVSYGAHLHLSTFGSSSANWASDTTAINPQRFFKYVSFTGNRSTLLSYSEEEEIE